LKCAPGLRDLCEEFTGQARAIYYDLLRMCATALSAQSPDLDDEDWFARQVLNGPQAFTINRYPPRSVTGTTKDGQFRVAPHTDWGISRR
jgi:isopenicillin N synthase-like dioxygenase